MAQAKEHLPKQVQSLELKPQYHQKKRKKTQRQILQQMGKKCFT
jgi:hypothetical protein